METINNTFETINLVDSAKSLLFSFIIFSMCLAISIYFLYNDFRRTNATINSYKRASKGNYSLNITYILNGIQYVNTVITNIKPTSKKIVIFYSNKEPLKIKLYNDTLIGSLILSSGILVLLVSLINFILVVKYDTTTFKKIVK